ncbi:signal peptidase I [Sphingomonas sp. UYAg733]
MAGAQRSIIARIGVTALNLLTPGLGILRVEGLKPAIPAIVTPTLFLLVLTLIGAIAPRPGFVVFITIGSAILIVVVAAYGYSIGRTWRASRDGFSQSRWSRWYGLIAILALGAIASNFTLKAFHALYKPFYIPAESMLPTLQVNDRILVDMRAGRKPARGDTIVLNVATRNIIYIQRVVALPGDRIAMRAGIPIINGKPPRLKDIGAAIYENEPGRIWEEQLAGEAGSHRIMDLGESQGDEMPERVIPPGHVFVLGDNRDRAADSRYGRTDFGVDLLPISDILGRPLFFYWSRDRTKIGKPVDR